MDHPTQEQMQYLGIVGIFTQSFKTISNSKKLFAQVTCFFIVQLALIFQGNLDMSPFFRDIEQHPNVLIMGPFEYNYTYNNQIQDSDTIWLQYVLFKMATVAIITIFSLFSTSVVVYTTASIYTGREITFSEAMTVVPKVWKRLTITLLTMFLALFVSNLIYNAVVFLCFAIDIAYVYTLVVLFIMYFHWSVYMMIVWEIACVVSVLEESYGLKAAMRAMDLMNGKKGVAFIVSLMFNLFMDVVMYVYAEFYINNNEDLALVWFLVIHFVCLFLFVIGFLVIIVAQTMLYLVCKSHHQETVDLGNLSTHFGANLNNPQPVQVGRPRV